MSNTERKAKAKREAAKESCRSARGAMRGDWPLSSRTLLAFLFLPFAMFVGGCRMDMQDQPRYEAYEAGDRKTFADGSSSRQLVEGTVPRGRAGEEFVDRRSDYFYTGQLTASGGGLQTQGAAATGDAGQTPNVANMGGGAQAPAQAGASQGVVREGGPDVFPRQILPITRETLERGRDRYNNFCAMCHGMTGEGDGMIVRRGFQRPPSLITDQGLQQGMASAAHIFKTITNGQGAMPSYADMLPPEDRWKIVAYIRALQLARNRPLAEIPEAERQKLGGAQAGAASQQPAAAGGAQD